jgi:hypothetical protein
MFLKIPGALLAQPTWLEPGPDSGPGTEAAGHCMAASGIRSLPLRRAAWRCSTTFIYFGGFLGRPEIIDFWGLGGPGGSGDPPKRWGAKPPTF